MRAWHDVAWVRTQRVEYSIPEIVTQPVLFSPHLVPTIGHPLIVTRGDDFVRELLAHRFYAYADFTSVLEREAVNVVTKDLARKIFWAELPPHMSRGAGRIYTDEAYHAQESDEILESIALETGIAPKHLYRPRFLSNLDLLLSALDASKQRLALIGFSIVSETLISSILADIPNDRSVVTCVREFVREHARDEGRHHSYFAELLKFGWPRLTESDREFLGPLLPKFVRWFLNPDLQWFRSFLTEKQFSTVAIEEIIGACYPSKSVSDQIRKAAGHSIACFKQVGVLESRRTTEAFIREGLLQIP